MSSIENLVISRGIVSAFLWIFAAFLIINILAWPGIGQITADAPAYIDLAKGLPALQPFAGRAAVPKLANFVASVAAIELERAFIVLKVLALLVFLGCTWIVAQKVGSDPLLFLALAALTPGVVRVYSLSFLPDMEFVALCSVVMLAFVASSSVGTFLSLILTSLVREVGIVVGLGIALVAAHRRHYVLSVAALVGTAIGAGVAGSIAGESPGNVHQMPEAIYAALKIPVNFFANWLGIRFF